MFSMNLDSDGSSDAAQLMMARKDTRSIDESAKGDHSSRITQLSKVKVDHENQEMHKIKRNETGSIELEFTHAKTSEIQDDSIKDQEQLLIEGREMTEEE